MCCCPHSTTWWSHSALKGRQRPAEPHCQPTDWAVLMQLRGDLKALSKRTTCRPEFYPMSTDLKMGSPGHRVPQATEIPPPVLHFKMQRSVTPSLLQHANRLTEWAPYTSRFQTTSVRISFSGQKTPYECICSCLLASFLSSSAVLL